MTDWPAVVREYGPLVWRTAYRLVGNDADAADCFQKTFLAAIELAVAGPVRHWGGALKRLATARGLDLLRARHRAAARGGELAADPPDPRPADPLDGAAAGELAGRLRSALAALDPLPAEVFCLVALDGLSNTEAAAQLGITVNHAGVLLHRARAALRDRLRAFDPAGEPP
ncbi:MAG TPA: sigma-70 family RNA polymerase sigma factor [Urbifossiella sp.]|jgi:RNA polymerase sigma-70 factor (ECF subfamily)|nr:sigma-70 family RNA polymerase sigma factor [Urbifossiella sp.]